MKTILPPLLATLAVTCYFFEIPALAALLGLGALLSVATWDQEAY